MLYYVCVHTCGPSMLRIKGSRRYLYTTLFIRTEAYTLGDTGGIALASATSNNQDAAMYVCMEVQYNMYSNWSSQMIERMEGEGFKAMATMLCIWRAVSSVTEYHQSG